jgi:cytochrome c553
MKAYNLKSRYKSLLFVSSVLLFTVFTGCSDNNKKDEKTKAEAASLPSKEAPMQKIEVTKNENALEIKVEAKEHDKNQSKSYYYDYNTKDSSKINSFIANEKALAEQTPSRTAIDANLYVRSPYEKIQISMLVKKLSKKFIVKCSACHNDYANGVVGPSLLGKDSDYIYNKIAEFKSGKAKNVLMTDLINQMDDKEIRELANEIHQFNKSIEEMRK